MKQKDEFRGSIHSNALSNQPSTGSSTWLFHFINPFPFFFYSLRINLFLFEPTLGQIDGCRCEAHAFHFHGIFLLIWREIKGILDKGKFLRNSIKSKELRRKVMPLSYCSPSLNQSKKSVTNPFILYFHNHSWPLDIVFVVMVTTVPT